MLKNSKTERVGQYVLTPHIQITNSGHFAAAVSISRGVYDRVFNFLPQFASDTMAADFAMSEARSMVLSNQLS